MPINHDPVTEQELAAKAIAPRVTAADIEASIAMEWYFNAAECANAAQAHTASDPLALLTICVLVLHNGYTIVGHSACASPANFDADTGKRLARGDAERQLWPLLGYRLRDRLHHAPAMSDAVAALAANVETCDNNARVNREGMITNPTKAAMYEALGASYRAAIARLVP